MMGLVWLLVWIVVIGLIFYVLWWAIGTIGIPEPFGKVARVLLVLAAVVVAIYLLLGILPPLHSISMK